MKNRILTGIILTAVLCTSMFIVSGCGKDEEADAPIISPIEITLSIDYPDKASWEDVKDVTFKLEEDSSVLEAIQLYCNVNEMPMLVETTGKTLYGINGINNGDIDSDRSWKFYVNGKTPRKSESKIILEDGDTLAWYYAE
ncbi:MAG: DUF4430 domain-containing protein [Emergencia sp.]